MYVTFFLHTRCTGEKIFPLVWEAVEALEMYDIPVVSLTSDGAKPNRRFYRLCQQQEKEKPKAIPYKSTNPFREGEELFFFCDAPHLLKTARNCFSNSYAHSQSRNMMVNCVCVCVCVIASSNSHFRVLCCHCRRRANQSVGSGLNGCT